MFTCEICQKQVKRLADHKRRMHPANADAGSDTISDAENGQNLELDTTGVNNAQDGKLYHCVDCGGTVSYKQGNCAGCTAELEWGDL